MRKPKGYWTEERIREDAKRFSSLADWSENGQSSYSKARKLNIHRQIAKELGWKIGYQLMWTFEFTLRKAARFRSNDEWLEEDPYSYNQAVKYKHLKKIQNVLGFKRNKKRRTFSGVFNIAAKCGSLNAWRKKDIASYQYALNKGWKDEICEKLGFDYKPKKKES